MKGMKTNRPAGRDEWIVRIMATCVGGAFLCIILGGLPWFLAQIALRKSGSDLGDLGNYGSFLQGTTGSLWTLAGVLIVFVAFLFQAIQLGEQRRQFKAQSDSLGRQNFENAFFQLLNLHHKLVENMVEQDATGRDCFQEWYSLLKEHYAQPPDLKAPRSAPAGSDIDWAVTCYDRLYAAHQEDLGHYFRNFYHLIKFVDDSRDIREVEKRQYTSLARAQLSSFEQALLFYNCIHPVSEEFWRLIERYGLFHNLDIRLLLDPGHRACYADAAYQGAKKLVGPNPRLGPDRK